MDLLNTIIATFVANIAFWLALGLAFSFIIGATQRRFRRFFGLSNGRLLYVCLSNLWHPKEGEPNTHAKYFLGLQELEASHAVNDLFGATNLRLPDVVRGLVDSMWAKNVKVAKSTVCPAVNLPGKAYKFMSENLVVVGATRWNTVRKHYLDEDLVTMCLSTEIEGNPKQHEGLPDYVLITKGAGKGDKIEATRLALGVIEKVRVAHSQEPAETLFFCAGATGEVSRACTEYLAHNWRRLQRDFGDNDFALCLGFSRDRKLRKDMPPEVLRKIGVSPR